MQMILSSLLMFSLEDCVRRKDSCRVQGSSHVLSVVQEYTTASTVKPFLSSHSKSRPKTLVFKTVYHSMQVKHIIISTLIKLPFVCMTLVLSGCI